MKDRIIEIIKKLKGENFDFTDHMYTDGSLDSMDIIRLIADFEDAFDVEIDVDEISMESFNSLTRIENLLNSLVDN